MKDLKVLEKLKEQFDPQFEKLAGDLALYIGKKGMDLVRHAYEFGLEAHKKQRRYSGEPYFDHCLHVANILAELRMDSVTLSAGLLHDVVEDTGVTLEEVQDRFGTDVAQLVDGVTKISDLKFESREERQAETFRKMMLSMVKDIRVIIIKLADRLHNMQTLEYVPNSRRESIAIETRDVYAPLAHRFGIARIKWELEDLVLKTLDNDAYESLNRKINQRREEREAYINQISDPIKTELAKAGKTAIVSGRPKHFFSIYNKMKRRNKPFEEIYDLLAIRIIVEKTEECYFTLGIVHNLFHPVYDRFKDYIAMPKLNGYQSLHTTVVGPKGRMVEIQIRTQEMHRTAEMGIAAHWKYKEGNEGDETLDKHLIWFRELVEQQMQEVDPRDFMESLKVDLYQDELFVFTPKGDLVKLPLHSSPIDFAFEIHTDVGMRCIGAKVNGKIVPLRSELKSGDQVEIITSKNQEPNQDWLTFVKTSKARTCIKRHLREIQHSQIVKLGEEILTKYLKKYNMSTSSPEFVEAIPKLGFQNLESLIYSIGKGEFTAFSMEKKLFPEDIPQEKKQSFFNKYIRRARSKTGIRVQGMNNIAINFGKCCQPVPGDKIIGFITRGRGITIHRIDCNNMLNLADQTERQVEVHWDIEKDQEFQVHITVTAEDRKNLLRDVSLAISKNDTNISMIEFKVMERTVRGNVVILVKDLHHLTRVLSSIRKIDGIIAVDRVENSVMTQ